MEIIKANIEDFVQLTRLINIAYEHENQWKTSLRTTEEEVRGILEAEAKQLFKGIIKDEIVACALLEINGSEATFEMLSLLPQFHGQGLGYQMILFLEETARTNSCKYMICEVASFNTHLMAYYKKLGYEWFDSQKWENPFLKIDNVTFELYRKLL